MSVSPKEIAALIGGPYHREIPRWEDLPRDPVKRVSMLRKQDIPQQVMRAMIELADLRRRAKVKFSRARDMFFDREGLEQSTGEAISQWRAQRFSGMETVADLTCGIGGDTIALAGHAKVFASDSSYPRTAMARENCYVYEVDSRVLIEDRPAEQAPEADAYFIDPSRRAEGHRSRFLSTLEPGPEMLKELIAKRQNVCIKLSPATPDEELELLGGSVEFVADGGVCKEATLWFGKLSREGRWAVVLPSGEEMDGTTSAPRPEVSRPLKYLFEPNPAIIRARAIPHLCQKLNAAVLDPHIAYMTADESTRTPMGTWYSVIRYLPFSMKPLRSALHEIGAGQIIVKKRGTATDADALRKQLISDRTGEAVVFVTRIGPRPVAIICRPPTAT